MSVLSKWNYAVFFIYNKGRITNTRECTVRLPYKDTSDAERRSGLRSDRKPRPKLRSRPKVLPS